MMSRINYNFVDVERSRTSATALQQWLPDDRNNIMQVSYSDRATVRDCPMNRAGRPLRESEIETPPTQPVRRRIGLACARCRKRKIKCSGDLGQGIGCSNCRSSGADTCNFYRVGAQEVGNFPLGTNHCNGFTSTPSLSSIQMYPSQPYGYSRSYPYAQSELNLSTKHLGTAHWSTGGYDTDSPIEPYGSLTSHGIHTSEPYSSGYNLHDGGRYWNGSAPRQSINVTDYVDPMPIQGYNAIPMSAAAHRNAMLATADQSMMSGHAFSLHHQMPNQTDRVLPMPNLRQQQSIAPNVQEVSMKASALSLNPVWTPGNIGMEARNQLATSSTSTSETMATSTAKASSKPTSASEANSAVYRIGDLDDSSTALAHGSIPNSSQQFSRSRNISSSAGPTNSMHQQDAPLYSYGADRDRNSLDDCSSAEDSFVSSRKYEPLILRTTESNAKGATPRTPSSRAGLLQSVTQ